MTRPLLLRPDRIRILEKPFAWIPFRLVKDGIFAELSDRAKLLYLFLCLVGNRLGISFYSDDRIQSYFQLNGNEIHLARNELIVKDLLSYDGRIYQVLSLPSMSHISPCQTCSVPQRRTSEPEQLGEILKRLARSSR